MNMLVTNTVSAMIRAERDGVKPALPMVWLHGWGMNAGIWQVLPQRLRHGALMLNLPGHGGSPWVDALGGDISRWAAYLLESAPERAVWVGWSLGGLLAMQAARMAPKRVAGLGLIASSPRFVVDGSWSCGVAGEVLKAFEEGLEHDYEATLQRFIALQTVGSSGAREARVALVRSMEKGGKPHPAALRGGLEILRQADLRDWDGLDRIPLRVLLGGHDRIVPPSVAKFFQQRAPGARVDVLEGAGHAPFLHDPVLMNAWGRSWP